MKIQNIIIGAVACIALLFGIISYNKTPEKVAGVRGEMGSEGVKGDRGERGEQGIRGEKGDRGNDGITKVVTVPAPALKLGAISGPEVSSDYFCVNGVCRYYFSSKFNNASTTLCSFKLPSATSTLVSASLQVTTATATAIVVDLGEGAIYDATTTKIGTTYTVAATAQDTIIASSSPAAGATTLLSPSNYLNYKFGSSAITPTTNSLAGTCKATVEVN